MKIAIVCDDLIQRGGQENVVEAVSELWPNADIFTPIASDLWLTKFNKRNVKVVTSFMQVLPFKVKLNRFYSIFLLHILGLESFNFDKYNLVFSISSRYAHHVITRPDQIHVCYMNSPGRMFWEPDGYFFPRTKKVLSYLLSFFRISDFVAARSVDFFIANSNIAQKRIKKYLKRDSVIVYPFVDFEKFRRFQVKTTSTPDYFLVITRLISWKKVEIAIEACKKLGFKLKIIGEGPDMARLVKLADNNIELLGYISNSAKIEAIQGCSALINTQLEDFGIVPLEAMAMGKPVIAFGKGGATETIVDGKTGIFFEEQTVSSLCDAINRFEHLNFSETECISRAGEFSKEIFKEKIQNVVNDLTGKNI